MIDRYSLPEDASVRDHELCLFISQSQDDLKNGDTVTFLDDDKFECAIEPQDVIEHMLETVSITELSPILRRIINGDSMAAMSDCLEHFFDDSVSDLIKHNLGE